MPYLQPSRRIAALFLFALLLLPGAAAAASAPAPAPAKNGAVQTGPEAFPLDRIKIVLEGNPKRLLLLDLVLMVEPGQGQVLRGKRDAMIGAISAAIVAVPADQFLDGNEAVRVKKLARQGLDREGFTQVRDVLIHFLQLR